MKSVARCIRLGLSLLALSLVMGPDGPFVTPSNAGSGERRALRKFKGPYQGSWTRGGTPLPLTLRMPKKGEGKGGGKFEATPCDSDDRLSPLGVKVTSYRLSRNGKKLVSRGKAIWQRKKIRQLGGPNRSGKFKLVAKLRGNKPTAKGRLKTGPLGGRLNIQKRGVLPAVAAPWMEMVWVGNPGNPRDPQDSDSGTSGLQRLGAMSADFKIGKYEVTNVQYLTFLNAVAAADPNQLYAPEMGTDPRGGISQLGTSPNYSYLVRFNMGLKPVNFVSFVNACRFCNWLHSGRPNGAQGLGTTETGAYDLTDPAKISNNTFGRAKGAKYFLPTENQWYKAAFHQPKKAGGDFDNYWLYPTQSNSQPAVATVNPIGNIVNDSPNITNYNSGAIWNGQTGNVTTVGSGGPGSASFYGLFDAGGNILEMNEKRIGPGLRGSRGGAFDLPANFLRSSYADVANVSGSGNVVTGFRVASPAP